MLLQSNALQQPRNSRAAELRYAYLKIMPTNLPIEVVQLVCGPVRTQLEQLHPIGKVRKYLGRQLKVDEL